MTVDVQMASACTSVPSEDQLREWAKLAKRQRPDAQLVIRVVDKEESAMLNATYRQKEGPTNVLSFPFEHPIGLPDDAVIDDILGDIVICAPVVEQEANEQSKGIDKHWSHMVIHGCLHLQGYDHIEETERLEMETVEIKLLETIGIKNPYEG